MSAGLLLLCLALLLSWSSSAMHIAWSDRPVYGMSLKNVQQATRKKRLVWLVAATAPFGVCVLLYGLGHAQRWTAVAIVAALMLIRRVEVADWPGDIVVRLGKYVPAGAALSAWLVASQIALWLGEPAPRAETLGWHAGCGVLGGAYVLSAIAKLRLTGWDWMRSHHHALLIAERAYTGPRFIRNARHVVARSKRVGTVVGVVGLFVEIAAALFIVPGARLYVAAAIVSMHIGIWALLGYFEPEWYLVFGALLLLAN